MFLIVTYDLKSQRDRTPLFHAIESFGPSSHFMASAWLLRTEKSPAELADALRAHMAPPDSIFVAKLSGEGAAWLPQRASEWIAKQQQLARKRKITTAAELRASAHSHPVHQFRDVPLKQATE
jgi:hypothetical protein